jgi:hypothetical protein
MKTLKRAALTFLPALVLAVAAISGPAASPAPAGSEGDRKTRNIELLDTAFKLKTLGWGVEKKGIIEGGSIESLITAARLLKEVPKPAKVTDAPEVGKADGAPEDTDTTLSKEEPIDLGAEARELLERARLLVDRTLTDPKMKGASEVLIADAERLSGTRDLRGGPKAISRHLGPGQTHAYHWVWDNHLPASASFRSTYPVHVSIVQSNGVRIAGGYGSSGAHSWIANGPGRPNGKGIHFTLTISNPHRVPVRYELYAD